ncbi:MAG: class I SAM-dependent DNA methyltransferase, partial [Anaerolineae bacterium]
EPAIFGTLFERSLDPDKRAQLGAHYTSREDILLIVEPVLMRPLEREWERLLGEAQAIRPKYDEALTTSNKRQQTTYSKQLETLRETMLAQLREVSVLDPACGSGNFLYVALQRLMDMEKAVIKHPVFSGLPEPFPEVHPRQMYGIEINPIAHALASIVVWIGYLQWRRTNGYLTHVKEPILEDIHENIVCKDAILAYDADGNPTEPDWPAVDVIIGNPPFLGDKKMRRELGDVYVNTLRSLYSKRISGQADFVLYWHEKSRKQIEIKKTRRVGLLSTNSVRGGANREVLDNIKATGDIFMAYADREWILDGASVRVSMVGFDNGAETEKTLEGVPVTTINADLTSTVDVTIAQKLSENADLSFVGIQKTGAFDITRKQAEKFIKEKNASGLNNSDVIRPTANAKDIVREHTDTWIIDFNEMPLEQARYYEAPFQYIVENVKPEREKNRRKRTRENWWIHGESRPGMRNAVKDLDKFIITPLVAKHRVFVWENTRLLPSNLLIAIARDDDYFFGVLHSTLHEVWSLRMGTSLEDRPRYTPTTTFETFPFPYVPGQEDSTSEAYQAISACARQLHQEREAWLNPPNASKSALKHRTLTNLYNALAVFRGQDSMKIKPEAGDFAPRLAELHDALDQAVCSAYGWEPDMLQDEEAILRHLLALNLARAEGQ